MSTELSEKERVRWNDTEIDLLARQFVKLRLKDPYVSVGILFDKCQTDVLEENRRREISSLGYVPGLRERINHYWSQAIQLEPPPPQIIKVEVEKPVDYVEILNRLGASTLGGMLVERLLQMFAPQNAGAVIESNGSTARLDKPSVTIQSLLSKPAQEKKHELPRVAIITHEAPLFSKIKEGVDHGKIPVELRFVDLDQRAPVIPHSADYIIFPHVCTGPAWRTALDNWPRKNVFLIPKERTGTLENAVLQKVRDIASMQRAA